MPRNESQWLIDERNRRRMMNAHRMRRGIARFYNGALGMRFRHEPPFYAWHRRPAPSMTQYRPQWNMQRVQRRWFNRQSMRGGRRVRNRALPAAMAA